MMNICFVTFADLKPFCSIKLVFRLLDVVDREAFGMRSEGWVKVKHAFATATPPLALVDDFIKLLTGEDKFLAAKAVGPAVEHGP